MAKQDIVIPEGFLEEKFGVERENFAKPPETSEFFSWGDLGKGIIGAPVEFANDLYQLGKFTNQYTHPLGDFLPDWETEDVVGERTSTVGAITQEAIPWLFAFTKVSKVLATGSKALRLGPLRALSKTAQKRLARIGNLKGAAATQIGREALASGVTTSALYDPGDSNVTDLLNQVPYLQDIVPDFLESNPDDHEAIARLKAGLEDAMLGGVIDSMVVVLRGVRAGNAFKKANPEISSAELDKRINEAIDADELAIAMENDGLVRSSQAPDDFIGPTRPVDGMDGQPVLDNAGLSVRMIDDADVTSSREALEQSEMIIPENANELMEIAEARNPEDFTEILNPRERDEAGNYVYSTADLYQRLTLRRGTNVSDMLLSTTNPKEMVSMMRAVDLRNRALINGKTQTTEQHLFESMQKLQDYYSVDRDGLIRAIAPDLASRRAVGMSDPDLMREIGLAAKAHEMTLSSLFDQFARKMKRYERLGDEQSLLDSQVTLLAFENAQNYVRSVRSEAARTLRFSQTPLGGMSPSAIKKILKAQGLDEKAIRKEIEKVTAVMKASNGLDPLEQAAALNKLLKGKRYRWGDVVTEYWINSILSGPTTHVANILGNSMSAVLRPLELATGGVLSLNPRALRAAWEQTKFLTSDVIDALTLGLSVERNEFLRPLGATKWQGTGSNRSIGKHTVSRQFAENSPGLTNLIEVVGKTINIPGSALETMDNFFKQINFRSRLKMRLMDKAMFELGMPQKEAGRYVIDEMDRVYASGQLVASEAFFKQGLAEGLNIHKGDRGKALLHAKQHAREQFTENRQFIEEAMEFAEEGTYTRPHSKERGPVSGIARKMQEATSEYWPLRFWIPFVGTPTNLLLFAADRMDPREMAKLIAEPLMMRKSTPSLNKIRSRLVRELRSGDVVLQREAMGRILLTNATLVTAWQLAMQGKITGRGPADRKERKQLEDAEAFQPYSVIVNGNAFSYSRLDPFATIVGVAADLAYAHAQSTPDDVSDIEATVQGLWTVVQNNFTNKSYLVGLKSFGNLWNAETVEDAAKALRPIAGGFVPSAVTRTLGAAPVPVTGDPAMREVMSMTEYALSRVPYFSKSLPPQRNVLGDVLQKNETYAERPGLSIAEALFLPIQYTSVKDKTVMAELASITGSVFYPPQKSLGGVDFRDFVNADGQDAYDRFLELHGVVTLGRMTLKQRLKDLFKSRRYQMAASEGAPGIPSPRAALIKSTISKYRRVAKLDLLREYPELDAALRMHKVQKRQAATSNARAAVANALNY